MKLFEGEFLGGTFGAVLTGAALVSLAAPVARKVIRPLTRSALKGAHVMADGFRQAGQELKNEWQQMEQTNLSGNSHDNTAVTEAWRNDNQTLQ